MACTVYYADGQIRHVKNLGWLLRHWQEVESFTVESHPTRATGALLKVHMTNGRRYESTFESKEVLFSFLHRPVFESLSCSWFGSMTTLQRRRPNNVAYLSD